MAMATVALIAMACLIQFVADRFVRFLNER